MFKPYKPTKLTKTERLCIEEFIRTHLIPAEGRKISCYKLIGQFSLWSEQEDTLWDVFFTPHKIWSGICESIESGFWPYEISETKKNAPCLKGCCCDVKIRFEVPATD